MVFKLKIALVQFDSLWEQSEENLQQAEQYIARASADECELIVFPEMFTTGFSMNLDAIGSADNRGAQARLKAYSKQYQITILSGIAEYSDTSNKANNIAMVSDPIGDCLLSYRKQTPFSFANENAFFEAGDASGTFTLGGVNCGVFICYDLRFPELFRRIAKQVQVMFVIANWPESRRCHWQALLTARAIENQCFVVGVNRIGVDGNGLSYVGDSRVVNPLGETVLEMDASMAYAVTEIDIPSVATTRERFPFLADMKGSV